MNISSVYKQIIALILSGLILIGVLVVQSLGRFADEVPSVLNLLSERSGIWHSARLLKEDSERTVTSFLINNSIEIIRDKNDVVHIYAQNDMEAYVGLGWIMMHDRFHQMQLMPRFVSASVSEMLGASAESIDKNFAHLQMDDLVANMNSRLSEDENSRVQAFSNGVNMYLSTLEKTDMPILLRYENLPLVYFKPTNIFRNLLLWQYLNSFDYRDVALQHITNIFGENDARKHYSASTFVEGPLSEHENRIDLNALIQILHNSDSERSRWVGDRVEHASASFQIGSNKTTSGATINAAQIVGPPLWPSLFYEVNIVTPRKNIYGLALVGTPFILNGTNGNVAWNITKANKDFINWYEVDDIAQLSEKEISIKSKDGHVSKMKSKKLDKTYPVIELNNRAVAFDWAPSLHKNVFRGLDYLYMAKSVDDVSESTIQNLSGLSANLSLSDATKGKIVLLRPDEFVPESGVRGYSEKRASYTAKKNDASLVDLNINNDYSETLAGKRLTTILGRKSKITLEDVLDVFGDKKVNLGNIESVILESISSLKDKHWLDVTTDFTSWNYEAGVDARLPVLLNPFLDLLRKNTWDEIDFPGTVYPEDTILFTYVTKNGKDKIFDIQQTAPVELVQDVIHRSIDEAFRLNLIEHGNYPNWNWASSNRVSLSSFYSSRFPLIVTNRSLGVDGFQNSISGMYKGKRQSRDVANIVFDVRKTGTSVFVQGIVASKESFLNPAYIENRQQKWLDRNWVQALLNSSEIKNSPKQKFVIKPAFQ